MKWFLKIPRIDLSGWAPSETWENLLKVWSAAGIRGLILPVGLSQNSGKDLDEISALMEHAKTNELQAWIVLPILNNRSLYEQHEEERPRHRHGKQFDFPAWFAPICPSSRRIRNLISEILSNPLISLPYDVLLLDYLRIPYFWEKWGNTVPESEWPPFCYCERCVNDFHAETGLYLDFATPEQWQRWQCSVILDLLGQLQKEVKQARPRISLGVQVLPLVSQMDRSIRSEWIGQNLRALQKYADFFSPQLYSNLLDWHEDELLSYLVQFVNHERMPVIPSFQVSPTRWDRGVDESSQNIRRLKRRLRPLGIESATLFHAKNLSSLAEIIRILGD